MALTQHLHLLLVGAALSLIITFFSGSAEAGEVGVCYGMMGSNLMQPAAVVQLLQKNGITKVRLYDADAGALRALANTGIKVGVSLPNQNLVDAAGGGGGTAGMFYALQWVHRNVMAYPGTLIDSVSVGNEVFHQAPELTHHLLPAMRNIQAALASLDLDGAVKVISPIALDALKVPSFPPSVSEFRDDIAWSVMLPMVEFLIDTNSYISFNIYPYLAYKYNPEQIDLDFVLFRPNKGQYDPGTGLTYFNMFDAMTDAVFHAVGKLGDSYTRDREDGQPRTRRMLGGSGFEIWVPESGFPERKIGSSVEAESTSNAQIYNVNLISKVLGGTGTPYIPNLDISVYIFALFNENQKPVDDDERHFGLFYPDGTPVYKVDFNRNGSWCVANPAVGDQRLQDALDYACGHGADCGAIQRGGRCFDPDTKVAHASYAFNDYYQRHGRSDQSCDFAGCGSVVHQRPRFGNCVL